MRVGFPEAGLVAVAVEEYDVGVPGQQYGLGISARVAVGYGKMRVKASLGTRTVEVEKYCVILEN